MHKELGREQEKPSRVTQLLMPRAEPFISNPEWAVRWSPQSAPTKQCFPPYQGPSKLLAGFCCSFHLALKVWRALYPRQQTWGEIGFLWPHGLPCTEGQSHCLIASYSWGRQLLPEPTVTTTTLSFLPHSYEGPETTMSRPLPTPSCIRSPDTEIAWPETIFRTAKFNCPGYCIKSSGVPPKHLPWHHLEVDAWEVARCFNLWSQASWRRAAQLVQVIRAEIRVRAAQQPAGRLTALRLHLPADSI